MLKINIACFFYFVSVNKIYLFDQNSSSGYRILYQYYPIIVSIHDGKEYQMSVSYETVYRLSMIPSGKTNFLDYRQQEIIFMLDGK